MEQISTQKQHLALLDHKRKWPDHFASVSAASSSLATVTLMLMLIVESVQGSLPLESQDLCLLLLFVIIQQQSPTLSQWRVIPIIICSIVSSIRD